MKSFRVGVLLACCAAAVTSSAETPLTLSTEIHQRCLQVLRGGMRDGEFWPSIHAAEALTIAGRRDEVRAFLSPKLETETDDQRRCGLARELVRAGDRGQATVLLNLLADADPYGHVHAAESLYKVGWDGEARPLIDALDKPDDLRLQLMAAAALAKHGKGEIATRAYAFLRRTLRDEPDQENFRIAAWVLARIGDGRDIDLIRSRMVESTQDALTVAFLQHALAALGDPTGKDALRRNLKSTDPAIRTYAAVFAGDAGMTDTAPLLIGQLEDDNADARIRAAQSLIVLSSQ